MSPSAGLRTVVLISGRGSNLGALIDATENADLDIDIRAVISNRPGAAGLATAASHGIACQVIDHMAFAVREAFEEALLATIEASSPELVILAGFMRILGQKTVANLAGRIINIHPSLLPAYPGLHTHERALAAADRIHGASIHFVTGELDGGPVISQVTLPTNQDDTAAALAARLLPLEHQLMVATVELFSERSVELRDDCVYVKNQPIHAPLALDHFGCLRRATEL